MNSKTIVQLEQEARKAKELLEDAKAEQQALRDAVMASVGCSGSQYHNHGLPRGIGKSTILIEAAHAWALQCPKEVKGNLIIEKTKLIVYAVRNMGEKESIKHTRLGKDEYMATEVFITCDTSENPSVLGTFLLGRQFDEVLIIVDEPKDFTALVNILTVVSPKVKPRNITTITLSSNYAE